MMIKHDASHLDHGLTQPQIDWIFAQCVEHNGFFIATFELPEELGRVACGLYGPIMGDAPVSEQQVFYANRGNRAYKSRMRNSDVGPRMVRTVSVIAGPHDGHDCVLYTAFGGPVAPQEPDDPGCKDKDASIAFWREHALAY